LSQSLDRGDNDVRRSAEWRMSIWMQSRIVMDERGQRITIWMMSGIAKDKERLP
jgi:hypothetical protein